MGVKAQLREVPLSDLVDSIVETYRPDAEISGHILEKAIEPNLKLAGDRRLIQQMLSNLLDNALAHTPAGTTISVLVNRTNDQTRFLVSDNGPGVAPEETADLIQRFTRGQRSRSGNGHGLGLALVAAIASAHGGKARLVSNRGFEITIDL